MPKKFTFKITDAIGDWPNTKRNVSRVMDENKNSAVSVRMSSLGGRLDDGLGIMNYFKDHGDVTCYLYEFNASASTIAAMGAKKVLVDKNSFFLIHKCSNFVLEWGSMNADEMQEAVDRLLKNKEDNAKIDEVMVAIYAEKTKLSNAKIMDLMERQPWMTANEAVTLGFADGFIDDESNEPVNQTASLSSDMVAKFNSLGVKLPPMPVEASTSPEANILQKIAALFKSSDSSEQNQKVMTKKKDFAKINSLLEVEELEFKDGKLNLSESQIQTINASIEASEQAVADKDVEIEGLQSQIEALKEKPGDTTSEPEDSEKESSNKPSTAKELWDKIKNY